MKKYIPYILIAPALVLIFILIIGIYNAILQSLGYIPSLGLNKITLQYYKSILTDKMFLDSLVLSLYISLISSILSVVIGVLISVILISKKQTGVLLKIIRIPILVPHMIVGLFVIVIFSQSGIISRLFFSFGLINNTSEFPNLIYNKGYLGVILAYIWKEAPFITYFTLSLMKSISHTLEETAINLGASKMRAFFAITLPLSLPSILNGFVIIFAFSFGAYELPFLLGLTKPKALPVQAYTEYIHPDLTHRPYAMAFNGVIIILIFIIAFLFQNKFRRFKDE